MSAPLPCGFFNYPYTDWGKGPGDNTTPPIWGASVVVVSPSNLNSVIDAADANNMIVFANFVDSRTHWTDPGPSGTRLYNAALYAAQIARYNEASLGTTLYLKLVDALRRRRLVCYVGDEFYIAQFAGTIDADDIDQMCYLHKTTFGVDCITVVRMGTHDLSILPSTGSWMWLDYGWSQSEGPSHLYSNGVTTQAYWAAEFSAFAAIGLGMIPGHNFLDGGDQTCWDYNNTGSSNGRIAGTFTGGGVVSAGQFLACAGADGGNTRWVTRPTQLRAVADALFDSTCAAMLAQAPCFMLWSHSPRGTSTDSVFTPLEDRSDMVSALDYVITTAAARTTFSGWRTPKGVPSPSPGGNRILRKKVTSFNTGTGAAGTTVTVAHGLGEMPKVIVLMWSGRTETTDAAGLASYQRGFGWSIGPVTGQNLAIASVSQHNGAAGTANNAHRAASNAACILTVTTAGAISGKADVQGWDSTNITFEILAQFASSLRITMLALGGSAIEHVATGVGTTPTTGTVPFTSDFTGAGFNPQSGGKSLALFMCAGDTATFAEVVSDDSGMAVGAAVSTSQRGVMYGGNEHLNASATAVREYTYNGECICGTRTASGSVQWRADFSAWITDGFRLNNLEITSLGLKFGWLIIDGPPVAVLQGTTSTTGAATVALTSAGFKPEAGLVLSARHAQNTQDTPTSGTGVSLGVFDGTNQAAQAAEESNNVATSVVRTAVEHDNCYAGVGSGGTLTAAMAVSTLDSDGLTFSMTDGDDGAFQFHTVLLAGIAGVLAGGSGLSRISEGQGAVAAAQLGGALET